eukprot:6705720-Pyramimonas_sp.AAC.1
MLSLQLVASTGWALGIADAKNAFCQTNRLQRPRGAIFVEACAGLGLSGEQLIELVAPRSFLGPCSWLQRSESGRLQSLILIEVDDFAVASDPKALPDLKRRLTERLKFGKWEEGKADYAGRQVRQVAGGKILVEQE